MEEGLEKKGRDEIFSKSVRAGRRTYFFDVKSTRRNDFYLTITESKKCFDKDGGFSFEKHKIFLYKEDFEKFSEGLTEAVNYIKSAIIEVLPENQQSAGGNGKDSEGNENEKNTEGNEVEKATIETNKKLKSYTDISFEDLDKEN